MYIYEKISHDGKTEGLIVLSESSYVGPESRTRKTIECSLATGSTLICGSSLSDAPLVAYPLDVRDESQAEKYVLTQGDEFKKEGVLQLSTKLARITQLGL